MGAATGGGVQGAFVETSEVSRRPSLSPPREKRKQSPERSPGPKGTERESLGGSIYSRLLLASSVSPSPGCHFKLHTQEHWLPPPQTL